MAYTLTGLFMVSTLASNIASPGPEGSSIRAGCSAEDERPLARGAVHLQAGPDSLGVRLVGRTDAAAGSIVQVVAFDGGEDPETCGLSALRRARPAGRVQAGPLGGFTFPVPSDAFGSAASLAVIWVGAGGQQGMAWTALPVQDPAIPLAAPPPRRALVVTEFMKDPAAVTDTRGEWFEVFNLSPVALDLDGWTLRDDGTNSTVLVAPGGAGVVPPGGFLVLGRNADPGLNGGVAIDIVYSGFTLANGADEIVLEAPGGFEIDRVDYGDGPLWPDDRGRSASLTAGAWGNDLALRPGSWCSSVSVMPGGDRGTPGALNDPCGP